MHGQIYPLISPLCPNYANKPGYGQLRIFVSVEVTRKRFENLSHQGLVPKAKQRPDMLQQLEP
jgi:hypothetical protein